MKKVVLIGISILMLAVVGLMVVVVLDPLGVLGFVLGPGEPFDEMAPPPAPDYSDPSVWVALPAGEPKVAEAQPVPVTVSARMPEEYAVEPETSQGRELLVAGVQVVVEGAERLLPGQRVRIDPLDGSPPEVAERGGDAGPAQAATPTEGAGGPASRQES